MVFGSFGKAQKTFLAALGWCWKSQGGANGVGMVLMA